jgi:uncharacterized protein (DUF2384 family)
LHLVQNLVFLRWDDSFAKAIGMSHRTYQRHASQPRAEWANVEAR